MGIVEDVEKGFDGAKSLIWDKLIEVAIQAIPTIPYIGPVLAFPLVKVFLNPILRAFADLIYKGMKSVGVDGTIFIKDKVHLDIFTKEDVRLKLIAHSYGINSKEFKDARIRSREALKNFGQFSIAQPSIIK